MNIEFSATTGARVTTTFQPTSLSDADHASLPTIEWLACHEHQEMIDAALERVATGKSTFADARLLALEIGLARASGQSH